LINANREGIVKMNYRKLFQAALVSVALLGLGGCETVNQSMSDTGDWFSNHNPFKSSGEETANTSTAAAPVSASCVPVTVVDDLKLLNQFTDEQAPRADNNVSSVAISNVSSRCTQGDKNVAVDLDITFDGVLGPKARKGNADKPSFAYPYFVAITLPDGKILTKEVFGVTMSYGKDQNTLTQHEHMRQVIPVQGGQAQQIVVGFQLTESQLAYNRSLEGKQNEAAGVVPAGGAAEPVKAATAKKHTVKKKHKKKPAAKKPAVKKAAHAPAAEAPAPAAEAPAPTAEAPAPATEAVPAPSAAPVPEVQATPPAQPSPEAAPAPAPATTTNSAPAPAPAPAATPPATDQPPATTPPTGAQ
jgi:hypothetical protein